MLSLHKCLLTFRVRAVLTREPSLAYTGIAGHMGFTSTVVTWVWCTILYDWNRPYVHCMCTFEDYGELREWIHGNVERERSQKTRRQIYLHILELNVTNQIAISAMRRRSRCSKHWWSVYQLRKQAFFVYVNHARTRSCSPPVLSNEGIATPITYNVLHSTCCPYTNVYLPSESEQFWPENPVWHTQE